MGEGKGKNSKSEGRGSGQGWMMLIGKKKEGGGIRREGKRSGEKGEWGVDRKLSGVHKIKQNTIIAKILSSYKSLTYSTDI